MLCRKKIVSVFDFSARYNHFFFVTERLLVSPIFFTVPLMPMFRIASAALAISFAGPVILFCGMPLSLSRFAVFARPAIKFRTNSGDTILNSIHPCCHVLQLPCLNQFDRIPFLIFRQLHAHSLNLLCTLLRNCPKDASACSIRSKSMALTISSVNSIPPKEG